MWHLCVLPLILYSALAQQIDGENRVLIPPDDNCLMDCIGNFNCNKSTQECTSMRRHYDLTEKDNSKLKQLLVDGHNGLRNRLSLKLDVCDLLKFVWDNSLAKLANRQHRHCKKLVSCTLINGGSHIKESLKRALHSQRVVRGDSTDVAVNSFFSSNIYLTHFIELAVGSWYEQHTNLNFPNKTVYLENEYYDISGENSFTHMINPHTHKIGCSYAIFHDGLSLICYYFPYLHIRIIFLRRMPKEHQCPYNFPILDDEFKRLCKYAGYSKS